METDLDYELFKKKILELTGLDLNSYKQKQMRRRLYSMLTRKSLKNFNEYYRLLKKDHEILEEFKNYVTINVTEFFRNPEKFNELAKNILPELIRKTKKPLKIWSAGCSLGAEAYTLAIIMREHFSSINYEILATDIDVDILNKARTGIYGKNEVRFISDELKKKYFNPVDNRYQIKDTLKKDVKFKKNNLLKDSFESGFNLILCRNVVIYFTEAAKDVLYKKFYESMVPGGILFVGGTENILNARSIGFVSPQTFFYQKPHTG